MRILTPTLTRGSRTLWTAPPPPPPPELPSGDSAEELTIPSVLSESEDEEEDEEKEVREHLKGIDARYEAVLV